MRKAPSSYTRETDGATMVLIAPHQYANVAIVQPGRRKASEEAEA